ncbi:MAG TPA: acyltransferase family protein, partial [Gemmatimonadaceae bacterium]|nr:acyltransferase family protein [Gemmatimonadaceae bacterium]
LRGGFVGVDVFFVISGFLITGILSSANDARTFSFLEFYARRARRIFPALVLVLLATVALGTLVLTALENERLGRHVLAGALFSANLLLWHEAGYFDAASGSKPLLHLWSLGIEEQFYLLWPCVILALSLPRLRRHRATITALIALASFTFGVRILGHDSAGAFYSPAARAWELMAGALLAMLPGASATARLSLRWRDIGALAGVLLVLGASILFAPNTPFPGWYALAPVLGATLLVAAGPESWVNRRVLSQPALVSLGLVSYPLYLWHWPLLVMLRRAAAGGTGLATPAPAATLAVLALSVVAAYGTHRMLELPLRRPALFPIARRVTFAIAAVGILGAILTFSRADLDRDTLKARQARNDWGTPKSEAVYFVTATHGAPSIAFVGDSHAEQYYPSVKHEAELHPDGPTVAFSTFGGCPLLPTFLPRLCQGPYARAMRLASSATVRRVIIASAWDMYAANGDQGEQYELPASALRASFAALEPDILRLRRLGKDVVLIGPHPHAEVADPELLAAHRRISAIGTIAPTRFASSFPLSAFRERTRVVNESLERLAARTGATLIDPASVLCPGGDCLTMDDHGTPIRKDSNHLRPFAAIRYLTYVHALMSFDHVIAGTNSGRGADRSVAALAPQ